MIAKAFLIISTFLLFGLNLNAQKNIQGAWKSDQGVLILAGDYFAFTAYSKTAFEYTYGGAWTNENGKMIFSYEFNTKDSTAVGTKYQATLEINGKTMVLDGITYTHIDDGTPGKLSGAWLFSNRIRNGKLGTPRSAENPRKTLKILSGTRFQWIAYNVDTKQFMGTGGGTYTTIDGKYTENIDFFSRDNSRVGASLVFDFEIKGNEWHHQGLSSKGDPIYEIWSRRK